MKGQKQSRTTKNNSFRAASKPVVSVASPSRDRASVRRKKPKDREPATRDKAITALGRMRRENISLSKACREEHIKPATFRRYVGKAVLRDKPGGRFRAASGDQLRRDLMIPTAMGLIAVPVYGSKNAKLVADYSNALAEYQRTGNRKKLDSFKGKTLKARGLEIELLTDPAILMELAEADALHFDQLYASATGAR